MAKTFEDLRKELREFVKPPVQIFPAKVNAVNLDEYSIDVEPVGGAELLDVRLKAGIDEIKDGLVEIPKVGSFVLVALIGNDKNTAVVLKTSEVEQTLINGGQIGGLTKAPTAEEKFAAIEQDINALKDVFNTWIVAPNDGGAALKGQAAAWAGQPLTVTQAGDLQDTKIKH